MSPELQKKKGWHRPHKKDFKKRVRGKLCQILVVQNWSSIKKVFFARSRTLIKYHLLKVHLNSYLTANIGEARVYLIGLQAGKWSTVKVFTITKHKNCQKNLPAMLKCNTLLPTGV